jgi:hypothetical protein
MDRARKISRRFARSLVCAAGLLAAAGCAALPRLPQAAGKLTLPTGPAATQSGDAATPARLASSISRATLPIPAGSRVEFPAPAAGTPAPVFVKSGAQDDKQAGNTAPAAAVTLAGPSSLTLETTRHDATGATTHAPPAPPSPAALAAAAGARLFYYLAAALGVCALALFYFGHGKAAILCVIGAAGLPLLASVSAAAASHAGAAVAAAAAALVAAWFFVRGRLASNEIRPPQLPPGPAAVS